MNHISTSRENFQLNPTDSLPEIEIISLSPVHDRGALKAFFSFRIGTLLTVLDARIIKENGKEAWVSMPVLSYRDQYQKPLYKSLVKIDDSSLKKQIFRLAMEAWKEALKDGKTT